MFLSRNGLEIRNTSSLIRLFPRKLWRELLRRSENQVSSSDFEAAILRRRLGSGLSRRHRRGAAHSSRIQGQPGIVNSTGSSSLQLSVRVGPPEIRPTGNISKHGILFSSIGSHNFPESPMCLPPRGCSAVRRSRFRPPATAMPYIGSSKRHSSKVVQMPATTNAALCVVLYTRLPQ